MNNPLISIIIPIYNVEKYLEPCINSVINQTYTNLEIILVNDGSTDHSSYIINKYIKKDSRIKVINKNNGGLSDARNAGIDIATGEYIGFIDSDDLITNNYFETLYGLLNNYGADISICNFTPFNDNKKNFNNSPLDVQLIEYTNIQALEQYFDEYYIQMVVAWGKLYKKDFFKNIRFPIGKMREDEFTTYKLLYKANKIVFTTECLYYYLQREDSIMGPSFSLKRELNFLEALNERYLFYEQKGLKILQKKTIRWYFNEIVAIYSELIKGTGNRSELLKLKRKAKDLYKIILQDKFSIVFRIYYFMFLKIPNITIFLHKVYSKVNLRLIKE